MLLTLKLSNELPAVITTASSDASYIPLSPSPKAIPDDKLPTVVPVRIAPNEPVETAEPLIFVDPDSTNRSVSSVVPKFNCLSNRG